MTQSTVNLSALRPLLFDYEPEQLAKLTKTQASSIKKARAVAEVDLLFRLAFLDTPRSLTAPRQPRQAPQPIAPLFAGVEPGATVRLAGGNYTGSVSLSADVSIVADGDVVWLAGPDGSCLQVAEGATVSVSGVGFQQVSPNSIMPVLLVNGSLHATDVQIRAQAGEGISVSGAAVLEQVLIDGGQSGIVLRGGAAELQQIRCIGQRAAGILIQANSSANMQDVTVQDAGIGVQLHGGQADTTRLTIVGCGEDGVLVGAGARLTGEDGAVKRCQGQALSVSPQGAIQLSGWILEENLGAGVLVRGGGRASLHAVSVVRQEIGVVVDVKGALSHRGCALGEVLALEGATVRERSATLLSTVVVDPAGGGDCTRIAEAIEKIDDGGLIQLWPGRYNESIELDLDVRIVGVGAAGDVVWSGYQHTLVAKGCAVTCQNITFRKDSGSRKDAVWLRGSEGIFTDCIFENVKLSALVVDERSRLRAEDCRFSDAQQGGIVVRENSYAAVERCLFTQTRMAAVHVRLNSDVTMRECRITNSGQGGVLVYEGARLMLERCEMRACGLAGVEVRDDAEATVLECRLLGGRQAAVFVHRNATATVERCDIIGTTRRNRPGVEVTDRGKLTLSSCRIRGSDAAVRCRNRSELVMHACDVAGNKRLQDKDRSARIDMARCRRGRDDLRLQVLLVDLEACGAVWPIPADARETDLRGAFLAGADLKGVNLDGADLSGAFAPDVSLVEASAQLTSFKKAFLSGGCLDRAKLHGADFEDSYLRRASMLGADTTQARFIGADTKGMAN